MKTVYETYNDYVTDLFIKKVKEGSISQYTTKLYEKASLKDLHVKNMGLLNCAPILQIGMLENAHPVKKLKSRF